VKYWEIIADNLSKAGWSWGYVSAVDTQGRTIWIADAHRGDGKRFVVRANEKLTAFLEVDKASERESKSKSSSLLTKRAMSLSASSAQHESRRRVLSKRTTKYIGGLGAR
jgi:hypothetical protein